MTSRDQVADVEGDHPAACPWCGQSRVRGITPSPDGNRWYRCAACTTTFFIHLTPQRRQTLLKNERAAHAYYVIDSSAAD